MAMNMEEGTLIQDYPKDLQNFLLGTLCGVCDLIKVVSPGIGSVAYEAYVEHFIESHCGGNLSVFAKWLASKMNEGEFTGIIIEWLYDHNKLAPRYTLNQVTFPKN